jgi:hypothetical protein
MKNFFKNLFKNKRPYPERVNEDPAKTKIVYAGPPKGLGRKNRMLCVYAGPGMMGQMKQRRDSEMEDVYAGPPMPDDIDEPEITEPEDIEPEIIEEADNTGESDNTKVVSDKDETSEIAGNTDKEIQDKPTPAVDPRMYSTMMVYAGPAGPARMSDDTSALGMMGAMMSNNPFFKTGTADVSGNNVAPASSDTDNGTPQKDNVEKTDEDGENSGNGTWV